MGGLAQPAMQAVMAGKVPPNEQGELQGGLTSLMSASAIFGPIIMTGLFSYFTGKDAPFKFPGAPFLAGAILTILSSVLTYRNFMKGKVMKEIAEQI